ncbi:MAG: cytochrome c biogenesis protein CcsA [Cyclobacteriaceae bacterium]|nr:cytochrome c biogenesis protein CcsA [Cyclobacteriaceae bacterium]MCH8514937.1 cytochrome c biogenesis protein CcsA [Cyclobacteriaceae bacterium]
MINTFVGDLGHLFVVLSFAFSLIATYAYYQHTSTSNADEKRQWRIFARTTFYAHFASILGVILALFYIIYNHMFEYHYAYAHSEINLPTHFMISCFWEGQEGSFLLWMFWNAVLGIVIVNTNRFWEGPVMTVFSGVQAFLTSMILGVVFFNLKIGSSPFILLRDAMDAPIFDIDPNFVPEDGTGLNPILQNIWMVIHPPTLFLGFSATMVPFAYAISGLWFKQYKEWIRPALPWTLFAAAILGAGILMGAIWAYETLSFGGYWNWDPVENAIYVPWLVLVASYHTMIIYKNSKTALKTSFVLVIATFILILYSTFLVRSGVLGEASVHSFTDLGLSGQLLIYMFTFLIISVALLIYRWKDIPGSEKEADTYSREFWIFIGAATLCLMGFQVLIPTSIPVYNAIIEAFGGISNVAPPANQEEFYSKFQLWFAVGVALLSGTGQFFYWKKMDKEKLKKAILTPALVSLLVSSLLIVLLGVDKLPYIILLTAAVFSIVANSKILFSFGKKVTRLSGGSIAHIGLAMMMIGILISSAYTNVISENDSGLLLSREFNQRQNQENKLLWLNEPTKMDRYEMTYKGMKMDVSGVPGYVDIHILKNTDDPYYKIAGIDIIKDGKVYVKKGERVRVQPENIYYEVAYTTDKGEQFSLFPRAQVNPSMGLIVSPDTRNYLHKDVYTHLTSIPDPTEEEEWSDTETFEVGIQERFFINDYVAVVEKVERIDSFEDIELGPGDIAVRADVKVHGKLNEELLQPVFIVKDNMVGRVPVVLPGYGIKMVFAGINPEKNTFTFDVNTTQKDWIIMKAIEKPMINLLWIGIVLLMVGFVIATRRRYIEFINERDKDLQRKEKKSELA